MKNYILLYLSALFFPLFFQSCLDAAESDVERQIREDDAAVQKYLNAHNIEAKNLDNGIYAEILNKNDQGKQIVEDHVVGILYRMIHLEGEYEIEVHSDTLNPVRFSNSHDVYHNSLYPAGLNYKIGEMREPEKYRYFIPSYQAYSNYSHDGLFDSYSSFMIEVEVVELKTEEEIYQKERESIQTYLEENELAAESYPNGLYYILLEDGTGEAPDPNSQVEFNMVRKYLDGSVIEAREGENAVSVTLNNKQLVKGLEEGIRLMREGERAKFIMPSKIAFGKSIQVLPQKLRFDWEEEDAIDPLTRPYSPVIYEIELLDVE